MKKSFFTFLMVTLLAGIGFGQNNKAWVELSVRNTEKILNDSPWAQTQTETDTSEMFFSPTRPGTSSTTQASISSRNKPSDQQSINNNRADRGATNEAVSVNYRVRLLSAKPIREAISRTVLLNQVEPGPDLIDQMQTLVDRDFSKFIVVIVSIDATDGRFLGQSIQAFGSATTSTLRNGTYLELKDGKRLYLMEYRAPQNDGLGAKYVFPRMVDGKPFVTAESGTLRFYSEVGGNIKLNVKYKISDMIADGKLEY